MNKLVTIGSLGLAGLVTTGLIAFQAPGAVADDSVYKRDDSQPDVVMTVDDDDDDDTNANTRDTNNGDTFTGQSRSTNDGTNSRFTGVSRDRDHSRSDLTKDFTKDGPGAGTRDHSANHTNDASRNDTRR